MKKTVAITFIITLMCMVCASVAYGQNVPRWVKKGVDELNRQRSNDSYELVSFNTWNFDLNWLKEHRTDPIGQYVTSTFGAQPGSIEIIPVSGGAHLQFKVMFVGQDGLNHVLDARLIDEFTEYNDYELNVYQHELYQLYAISRPDLTPIYDRFELTNSYNAKAVGMSLIPGMGQIYKGQDTKGYVILGSEVVFVGASLIFDYYRRDAKKMMKKEPYFAESWHSKELAWRNFEFGAVGCAVGVYIYNLIDAARSKGARQVKLHRAPAPRWSVMPFVAPDEAGMQLTINF